MSECGVWGISRARDADVVTFVARAWAVTPVVQGGGVPALVPATSVVSQPRGEKHVSCDTTTSELVTWDDGY